MAEYYPNIAKARIKADENFAAVLYWTGLTEEEYFQYEKGEKEISVDLLEQLAGCYGTSVDYLLGRTDVFEPYPWADPSFVLAQALFNKKQFMT